MTGTGARAWGATTAVIGAALVLRPKTSAGLVSSGSSAPNPVIVQVLGGRQLLQGAAVLVRPDGRLLLAVGAIVDVLHAVSMVLVARWWPRYRQPALVSAAAAGVSAAAGGLLTRNARR
jgi:hypothetical protein